MTDSHQVPLPGSARSDPTGLQQVGPVQPDDVVSFTVFLRRRAELPDELVEGPDTVSVEELGDHYGARPDEVNQVRAALEAAGAQVVQVHAGSRRIVATAPASAINGLFGVTLTTVRSTHPGTGQPVEHRGRSGELRVPAALDGVVTAVLGLDDRPQARNYARVRDAAAATGPSYTPVQLATVYGFPEADGTGQTAAIVELGGGYEAADLTTYFAGLKVPEPKVTAVGVDGGKNVPGGDPTGADGEVMLDIEVLGAIAPKSDILVYFAPNTDQGFVDAISTAVHATPTPAVVSISWGQSEDAWTAQTRTAIDNALADAAALGVTVTVAAGDAGSADSGTDSQQHVDFPASSPHALACGGTSLHADASGTVQSEVVWNDGSAGGSTGGGVSDTFPVPTWQNEAGVPTRSGATTTGRGVPDVSAVADPQTGYQVRVDGKDTVIGGTSAVAPLWAGLICRYAQLLGKKLGLMQTALYDSASKGRTATGFRDITSGNNGAYTAAAGWDPCTGLGVPIGTQLQSVLQDHSGVATEHGWAGPG
ncbi:MAG TPA: S53 family serine peptidase [Pseudonocardiaceae bacterium]|nr:S53 family serine peptidase [Pseudonocardiaceae bacterium]